MYDPVVGYDDAYAFVLAGGNSRRMGRDKAFVEFDGRSLLAKALDVTRAITPHVHVVGRRARFESFGPVVEDVFPDCGPLGGIHAALQATRAEMNLILAVDVPFVTADLLQFLLHRASSSKALVTVARVEARFHPLCAAYRREFGVVAEAALRQGRYKIDALFAPDKTQIIEQSELAAAGFSPEMFGNLNTPEDLAEASKPNNWERGTRN